VPTVVEDLRHFVLECPAYDGIRAKYGLLPARPWCVDDPDGTLRALFSEAPQLTLAHMLHAMKGARAEALGITWW
jgi:hypothetical protein